MSQNGCESQHNDNSVLPNVETCPENPNDHLSSDRVEEAEQSENIPVNSENANTESTAQEEEMSSPRARNDSVIDLLDSSSDEEDSTPNQPPLSNQGPSSASHQRGPLVHQGVSRSLPNPYETMLLNQISVFSFFH